MRGSPALRAELLLLLAAGIWGFAFVAQRVGMQHVGPFLFNGVRFALGALTLIPFLGNSFPLSRHHLLSGTLAGLVLFLGASLQQLGITTTTAGKAGFITGLYVVMVPLFGLFLGHRPPPGTWVGALTAAVGLYLLSISGRMEIAAGDALVLASAFFWAAHVLLIARLSAHLGWAILAFLQFAVCALLSLAVALLFEEFAAAALLAASGPILYGGVLSVGVAYTLQVIAQRHAPPAHAAILLSLETVFAALGGWLILDEVLSWRGIAGCGLMLAGMLLSQLSALRSRKESRPELGTRDVLEQH